MFQNSFDHLLSTIEQMFIECPCLSVHFSIIETLYILQEGTQLTARESYIPLTETTQLTEEHHPVMTIVNEVKQLVSKWTHIIEKDSRYIESDTIFGMGERTKLVMQQLLSKEVDSTTFI